MNPKLSAAEIKTLQTPETEQVKLILPLLLKELVLNDWVSVHKGKRPVNYTMWGLIAVFSIGTLAVYWAVGCFAIMITSIAFIISIQPKTLFSLTPEGEKQAKSFGPNSPLLVKTLYGIAYSRPEEYNNCTSKEWRKYLSRQYPDNATYHKDCLLFSLAHQGLVELRGKRNPKRTLAGDAVLAKAEAEIELGYELPRLLREDDPQAAVLAASLGGMLLLVPEMQGYFHMLGHAENFPEMGLAEPQKRQHSNDNFGGSNSSSGDSDKQKDGQPESDNGADWGENADFLDGDLGDGIDSGIGTESGCGVGADSSDSGDGGGDGGGCGGCGGGGD